MYKKLFKIIFTCLMMFMFTSNVLAEDFSDNYKKLTDGTITINTDGDLSKALVEDYLSRLYFSGIYFSPSGILKPDNTMDITMHVQGELPEEHTINIVKGSINATTFNDFDILNTYSIPADPGIESDSYTSSYIGSPEKDYNDGRTGSISYTSFTDSISGAFSYIVYEEWDADDEYTVSKLQYKKVTVNYTGYDNDNYSERYLNSIGKSLVVNTDSLEYDDIIGEIGGLIPYDYELLYCADDYSSCDILLKGETDNSSELHKVNITKDSTISSTFKKAFNLNASNKIEMISDTIVDFDRYIITDVNNKMDKEFVCDETDCSLVLCSDDGSFYERHNIEVSKIGTTATDSYKNSVGLTKNVYLGDNIFNKYSFEDNYYFGKDTKSYDCDESSMTCNVAVINGDGRLEVHSVTITLKTGKSPSFLEKYPVSSIAFNAVYKDDSYYLDVLSHAYMIKNGLYAGYMPSIGETEAIINLDYNGTPEQQTVSVSYKESDPVAEEVINNIIDSIGRK